MLVKLLKLMRYRSELRHFKQMKFEDVLTAFPFRNITYVGLTFVGLNKRVKSKLILNI
jgi:hypothetical protein